MNLAWQCPVHGSVSDTGTARHAHACSMGTPGTPGTSWPILFGCLAILISSGAFPLLFVKQPRMGMALERGVCLRRPLHYDLAGFPQHNLQAEGKEKRLPKTGRRRSPSGKNC